MSVTVRLRALLVAAVLFVAATPAYAQIDAGILANWADLATWTQYDETSRMTEIGLGLIPAGPTGTMRLSFEAKLDGRRPTKPPGRVGLRLAAPPLLNPAQVRSTTLRFEVDEKRQDRIAFEMSDRVLSLEATPGSYVSSASAFLTIDEFERLARAETVKADVLGIAVEFSAAQLKALRAYADKVMLRTRGR
jgi:hypothetical protein